MDTRTVTFRFRSGLQLPPIVMGVYQFNSNLARKQEQAPKDEEGTGDTEKKKVVRKFPTGYAEFSDIHDEVHRVQLDDVIHMTVVKTTAEPAS